MRVIGHTDRRATLMIIQDKNIRHLASLEEIRMQARRDRASVKALLERLERLERFAAHQIESADHPVDRSGVLLVCERLRSSSGYYEERNAEWIGPALGEILHCLGCSAKEIHEFYSRPPGRFTLPED